LPFAAPKGFNPYEDRSDGYKFLYPFGWQEVAVKGTDIVFKDIVEPLESVSVTLTKTDKKDITEFGEIQEVGNSNGNIAGQPIPRLMATDADH
jgi:photosystem II oxygen-evolving enhancer protein 2